MANEFQPNISPIWGIPMHWNIRDLDTRSAFSVQAIAATTIPATSAPITAGRSIRILPVFENASVVCTITVSQNSQVIKTFANVTIEDSASLYVGNFEFIDLGGEPFTIDVTAVTGGSVAINVRTTG